MPAPDLERRPPSSAAEIADEARRENDERERHVEEKDADEGRRREADHELFLRAFADAHDRLSTIASTAALRPKNRAETMPTLP